MSKYIAGVSKDRRGERPDSLTKTVRWLGVASWVIMFSALAIIGKARPEAETALDKKYNIVVQTTWDVELANYLFVLMIVGLILSLIGICIKQQRTRRRTDEYMYSLYILGITSTCGILYYLFVL
ncbi:MAG: hypothetical protein KKB30_15455 [Proteobacteria bacterium]|nr:hypothetical protein [Pseudomonadota bacterium]MBU1716321.1 hypothetical protein [Pseudomonadota bacterium]